MPVLTRKHILEHIESGGLKFDPPVDKFQLQPHALDLRIGHKFYLPRTYRMTDKGREAIRIGIDNPLTHADTYDEIMLQEGQYFDLLPSEFVIGTSLERIEMNAPNLMSILFPRTSTNRRGIDMSATGVIDTGYKGNLIFPMKNVTDQVIRLYPGERMCQMVIHQLSGDLSEAEAMMHGMAPAKYTDQESNLYKLDKDDERDRIIRGMIDELKDLFS